MTKERKLSIIFLISILVLEIAFVFVNAQEQPIIAPEEEYIQPLTVKEGADFKKGALVITPDLSNWLWVKNGNIILRTDGNKSCVIFDSYPNSTCFQDNKKIEYDYLSKELKFYPIENSTRSITIKNDGSIYFDVSNNDGIPYNKWSYQTTIYFSFSTSSDFGFGTNFVVELELPDQIKNKLLMCDFNGQYGYENGLNCDGVSNDDLDYKYQNGNSPSVNDIGYDIISMTMECTEYSHDDEGRDYCSSYNATATIAELKYVFGGTKKSVLIKAPSLSLANIGGLSNRIELPILGEWCGATVVNNNTNQRWRVIKCGNGYPGDAYPENNNKQCPKGYAYYKWGGDALFDYTDIGVCVRTGN